MTGKKFILYFFAVILILVSCNKEETIEIPANEEFLQGELNSIEACKSYFIQKANDNILIVDIQETKEYFNVVFEDGENLPVKKIRLKSVSMNMENWRTFLKYGDGSEQNLPSLGDNIGLEQRNVQLNPYSIAPLTALLSFKTNVEGKISTRLIGRNGDSSNIVYNSDAFGFDHVIPVAGLYAGYNNKLAVIFTDKNGKERAIEEITITTDPIPQAKAEELGDLKVLTDNYSEDDRGKMIFVSSNNIIIDTYGNVRWFLSKTTKTRRTFPTKDGEIMCQITGDRIAWDGQMMRINILGKKLKEYVIPSGVHHEIIQKEKGGNFLIGSSVGGTLPENTSDDDDTEDLILEIDKESGAIVREWNLRNYFDHDRERFSTEKKNDWFHLNSIQYLPDDNTLLLSSKLQCLVAKIGYDDGLVKWILGSHINWKTEFQKYLLTPVNFSSTIDPNEDFPYHQHCARLNANGNFLVYDNGTGRPGGAFVRGVEYKVNEENMTVEKVWEELTYGKSVYAPSHGSIEEDENGNILLGHANVNGGTTKAVDVDKQGNVLFEIKLPSGFYRVSKIRMDDFVEAIR